MDSRVRHRWFRNDRYSCIEGSGTLERLLSHRRWIRRLIFLPLGGWLWRPNVLPEVLGPSTLTGDYLYRSGDFSNWLMKPSLLMECCIVRGCALQPFYDGCHIALVDAPRRVNSSQLSSLTIRWLVPLHFATRIWDSAISECPRDPCFEWIKCVSVIQPLFVVTVKFRQRDWR